MSDAESIVLEHVRDIRGAVDGLRDDIRVKPLGILESQYALSSRMDRLGGRSIGSTVMLVEGVAAK